MSTLYLVVLMTFTPSDTNDQTVAELLKKENSHLISITRLFLSASISLETRFNSIILFVSPV